MPRRPRPASRAPPKKGNNARVLQPPLPASKPKTASKIRFADPELESDGEVEVASDGESSEFEEGSSNGSEVRLPLADRNSERERVEEDEEDADADAPRAAQWEEDNEEFLDESSEDEADADIPVEKSLQNNLQDLPLGTLRRAKQLLSQAEPDSDSESHTDSSDEEAEPELRDNKGKGKEKVEWSIKPRTDISKRSSKHAPVEVTSKRPVSRKRTVVEVPKIVPRDPRFLPTAGEFDQTKFQTSYGFLADSHKTELRTLRETLKQARKMLASSPRELRSEREHEVYRLEQAVKRTESTVNRDRLERVEREALGKVKKEEQDKRKQGKGEWFLKKTDKQQLVMKARYEALAKEGGQRAVKKAIEKKRKKVSQKEKKSRPYAKGQDGMNRKRGAEAAVDAGWPNKRRRV